MAFLSFTIFPYSSYEVLLHYLSWDLLGLLFGNCSWCFGFAKKGTGEFGFGLKNRGDTFSEGCRLVSAMSKVPKLVDLCVATVADELLRGNYARFSQITVSVSHGMADLVSYGNADCDSEQNFFLAMTKIMGTLGVLALDPWRLFLFVLKLECPWRFDFSWYDAAYH
ncbi:hypothetical protein BUALT_Bualt05G0126200 [Buddleja alternifolia]|uniref:Uncharacterized protein n=1 Tax=Buddleja alternifolia TaxID=168488 RepID=A0AAV6XIU5_9LAMI|nr:hypothetical protein BUALT_Bualt05G0126200 [Buddleja alternifolia]